MKLDQPKLVEQCHLVCGTKVMHLRLLYDGEGYQFDLHTLRLTSWKAVRRSSPDVPLTLKEAKELAEKQARITCGKDSLKFPWTSPTSAPRPSGRVRA
jgi:hypothetical protein